MSLGIVASSFLRAGGGGGGWSPTDEGGLVAWYRADDLSLSDNDSVSSWPDASGNSRTLTSSTGTDPIYKTGISPGGAPVVRFSAGQIASATFACLTEASLFWFGKWTSSSATQLGPGHGNTSNRGYGMYMNSSNQIKGLFGGVADFGSVAASTDWRSHGVLVDSTNPRGTLLVDDTSGGTTNAGAATSSNEPIRLGGKSGEYMNADMCEFIFFDHVLDSAARANLQTYFEARHL